jgi:hypothetical protein
MAKSLTSYMLQKQRHFFFMHRTAPHRTAPHRTAPHRTAPQAKAQKIKNKVLLLKLIASSLNSQHSRAAVL